LPSADTRSALWIMVGATGLAQFPGDDGDPPPEEALRARAEPASFAIEGIRHSKGSTLAPALRDFDTSALVAALGATNGDWWTALEQVGAIPKGLRVHVPDPVPWPDGLVEPPPTDDGVGWWLCKLIKRCK
jgi:hypothetical protein